MSVIIYGPGGIFAESLSTYVFNPNPLRRGYNWFTINYSPISKIKHLINKELNKSSYHSLKSEINSALSVILLLPLFKGLGFRSMVKH